MGVSGQTSGEHASHQLAEARVTGDIGAQHQGINKEPDQLLERVIGAASNEFRIKTRSDESLLGS